MLSFRVFMGVSLHSHDWLRHWPWELSSVSSPPRSLEVGVGRRGKCVHTSDLLTGSWGAEATSLKSQKASVSLLPGNSQGLGSPEARTMGENGVTYNSQYHNTGEAAGTPAWKSSERAPETTMRGR